MSTIELYKDKINSMSNYIEQAKTAVSDYCTDLSALKSKILSINSSVCDSIVSKISSSSQTQEQQIAGLEATQREVNDFIDLTIKRDNSASSAVAKAKDEFYKKYEYLKPDSEKSDWEKFCDTLEDVGEWCKEHWKIIVTIAIVVAAIILLVSGVGTGIGAAILTGACWGAISGAVIGGISGGIMSKLNGGTFFEGFENGAFDGAIGGAIGGAITGGLTTILGPASSLIQSICKGAGVGALSTGTSNMAVTAINYGATNGTLDGSLNEIIMSGIAGFVSGGILGGITGGIQFKLTRPFSEGGKIEYGQPDIQDFEFNMLENPGPLADMKGNPAGNFYGGRYNSQVLQQDTVFYRAGNAEQALGQYFVTEPPASVAQVRIDTAVKPQWINPTTGVCEGTSIINTVYAVKIPAGTTIYTGPVGPQGGVYCGGDDIIQTFIQTPWEIPGVEILDHWSLQ